MHRPSQFRLLTLHFAFYQSAAAIAGGFIGAFLLKLGFSLSAALVAYAALLVIRCTVRFIGLAVVRRFGYRTTVMLGAGICALQYVPLVHADTPLGLVSWIVVVSLAESLYWPVYHSAVAVTGQDASRGRELGVRTAVGALVNVAGPLAGGLIIARFGTSATFAMGAVLALLSVLPFFGMAEIAAGPVPSARNSLRGLDRSAILAFASDGWISSGFYLAWPMVLFVSLGSHYETFGFANAASGLVGAVTGLVAGHVIDRGGHGRSLVLVCAAVILVFAMRALSTGSPLMASAANAIGAAVMCLYVPVLMSVIYDRAKQSGAAYRFHFAAEAGWDAGAASGCLVAALVAAVTGLPALAVVPGAFGVVAMFLAVRRVRPRLPAVLAVGS